MTERCKWTAPGSLGCGADAEHDGLCWMHIEARAIREARDQRRADFLARDKAAGPWPTSMLAQESLDPPASWQPSPETVAAVRDAKTFRVDADLDCPHYDRDRGHDGMCSECGHEFWLRQIAGAHESARAGRERVAAIAESAALSVLCHEPVRGDMGRAFNNGVRAAAKAVREAMRKGAT
jgi:hypothetical protein